VPIIGPRTLEQLDGYLAALDIRLDAGVYDELDAVSSIDLGEPFTKLAAEQMLALAGDADAIRMRPVPSS
jgi:hypothetical protein